MFDAANRIYRGCLDVCGDYYNELPNNAWNKIAKSALYSFTASYLAVDKKITGAPFNFVPLLFAAGVAALASLIYALTEPLFKKVFEDDRVMFHREVIKVAVNTCLVSLLVNYSTTGKVNLFALPLLLSLSSNLLLGFFGLIPLTLDALLPTDPDVARDAALSLKHIGLNAVPGSSSVFVHLAKG